MKRQQLRERRQLYLGKNSARAWLTSIIFLLLGSSVIAKAQSAGSIQELGKVLESESTTVVTLTKSLIIDSNDTLIRLQAGQTLEAPDIPGCSVVIKSALNKPFIRVPALTGGDKDDEPAIIRNFKICDESGDDRSKSIVDVRGQLIMQQARIEGDDRGDGGGAPLVVVQGGKLLMHECDISGGSNTASGGGIALVSGSALMADSRISNCNSGTNGGAIAMDTSALLFIDSVKLSGNNAAQGDDIFIQDELNNSVFRPVTTDAADAATNNNNAPQQQQQQTQTSNQPPQDGTQDVFSDPAQSPDDTSSQGLQPQGGGGGPEQPQSPDDTSGQQPAQTPQSGQQQPPVSSSTPQFFRRRLLVPRRALLQDESGALKTEDESGASGLFGVHSGDVVALKDADVVGGLPRELQASQSGFNEYTQHAELLQQYTAYGQVTKSKNRNIIISVCVVGAVLIFVCCLFCFVRRPHSSYKSFIRKNTGKGRGESRAIDTKKKGTKGTDAAGVVGQGKVVVGFDDIYSQSDVSGAVDDATNKGTTHNMRGKQHDGPVLYNIESNDQLDSKDMLDTGLVSSGEGRVASAARPSKNVAAEVLSDEFMASPNRASSSVNDRSARAGLAGKDAARAQQGGGRVVSASVDQQNLRAASETRGGGEGDIMTSANGALERSGNSEVPGILHDPTGKHSAAKDAAHDGLPSTLSQLQHYSQELGNGARASERSSRRASKNTQETGGPRGTRGSVRSAHVEAAAGPSNKAGGAGAGSNAGVEAGHGSYRRGRGSEGVDPGRGGSTHKRGGVPAAHDSQQSKQGQQAAYGRYPKAGASQGRDGEPMGSARDGDVLDKPGRPFAGLPDPDPMYDALCHAEIARIMGSKVDDEVERVLRSNSRDINIKLVQYGLNDANRYVKARTPETRSVSTRSRGAAKQYHGVHHAHNQPTSQQAYIPVHATYGNGSMSSHFTQGSNPLFEGGMGDGMGVQFDGIKVGGYGDPPAQHGSDVGHNGAHVFAQSTRGGQKQAAMMQQEQMVSYLNPLGDMGH